MSASISVPTSAPTVSRSVITTVSSLPSVSYLSTATLSRTRVTFSAHLIREEMTQNYFIGGILYCIALNNGLAPSNIGSIKSAGIDGTTSLGATAVIPVTSTYPLNLNVTFTGLKALRSYAIYCYVESSTGVGNTLTTVLFTKRVVSTPCCKVVKYSNSPSYLHGNDSEYIGSDQSLYVFTYTLSASPSTAIQVTPLLYLNGILTTEVKAIPLSVNYNSTSLLTGSFILSSNALVNGSFVLVLSVTGLSAIEYYNTTTTVQILSSNSVLPSPKMISSRFSHTGKKVLVAFNTPTDLAGIVLATWPCSRLFSFISASLTTCKWTTAAIVTMTFKLSNSANLIPGNNVTLTGGQLKVSCSGTQCAKNVAASQSSLPTSAPVNPISPVVVLNTASSIGPYTNLVLDARASYGNGGRLYTSIQWILSGTEGNSSFASIDITISNFLKRFSSEDLISKLITIPAQYLLNKTSYTITLGLTNFLGRTSFTTVTVTVITIPNLLSLSIIGPSYRTIVVSSPLTILSAATLTSWASRTSVSFVWNVQEGNQSAVTDIKSSSLDPSIFAIPAYSLVVNNVYTITVTASTSTSTVNASTIVYVAHGVVTAAIVGGTNRCTSVDRVLQLDASGSYDSDYRNSSVSTLTYQVQHY